MVQCHLDHTQPLLLCLLQKRPSRYRWVLDDPCGVLDIPTNTLAGIHGEQNPSQAAVAWLMARSAATMELYCFQMPTKAVEASMVS